MHKYFGRKKISSKGFLLEKSGTDPDNLLTERGSTILAYEISHFVHGSLALGKSRTVAVTHGVLCQLSAEVEPHTQHARH